MAKVVPIRPIIFDVSEYLQEVVTKQVSVLYEYMEAMLAAYATKHGGLPSDGVVRIEESDGTFRHFILHPPKRVTPVDPHHEARRIAYTMKWTEWAGELQPEDAEVVLRAPTKEMAGRIEIVARPEVFAS